jgi:hypothetical protein
VSEVPPLTPLATAALHVGEPERILVVECGEGEPALFLAREFPRASVRGVDADEAAIRRAAGRVDLVALLDAEPPPREVARVLHPGGYLLLARSAGDLQAGLGARLRGWRLRRAGIEPIWSELAGEGSYSVGRLRGGVPPAPQE